MLKIRDTGASERCLTLLGRTWEILQVQGKPPDPPAWVQSRWKVSDPGSLKQALGCLPRTQPCGPPSA